MSQETSPKLQNNKKIKTIDLIIEDDELNNDENDELNNAVILINQTHLDLEADPHTSKNIYEKHLKAIRPSSKEIGSNKGRFTQKMYDSYKWLEYSLSTNKLFCFPCRMFCCGTKPQGKILYSLPFRYLILMVFVKALLSV
jgi:hypothetical protein